MARCFCLDLAVLPRSSSLTCARIRLIAAIVGSVVVHLSLGWVMTGGTVGGLHPTSAPPVFQISLVDPAPPPPVAPNLRTQDQLTENARHSTPAAPAAPHAPALASAPVVDQPPGSSAVLEGPDPTYYSAKQLDVYPALVSELDLRPLITARSGSSTRARLLLFIDEVGMVFEASIVEGDSASRSEAARHAFLLARFTPAYRNGRAVKSRVLVEVNVAETAPAH